MSRSPRHPSLILVFALSGTMAGLALPGGLPAQEGELVDRIVAVVGDSAITLSQVQERIAQLQYQRVQVPAEGTEAFTRLERDLVDQMVAEQLIVQAALRDTTITVNDADLEDMVNQDLQQRSSSFGSQAAFQQALGEAGWTPATYREFVRGQVRQQQLYTLYMQKRSRELSTILVESSEIEEFYQAQRDAIGQRPPTVTFKQVVVAPTPSDSAWEAARLETERIRQMAVDGEEFEDLARRFSQDPGSAQNGGDLGWFRRGEMVPTFEEAAFNLVAGAVSEPVKTPYGYHIIKVERRRSGEVRARHILITVNPTPADQEAARERAYEVRGRLEGGADIDQLIEQYGDPETPDSLQYSFDQLRELPPGFPEPLLQSEPGELIGPLEYQPGGGAMRFAVIKVLSVQEGRPWSLEDADLRAQIRQNIQQGKLLDRILEELRASTYVEIRI